MFLADLCVNRSVLATKRILCLVVMGWFWYNRLGRGPLPKSERLTVSIPSFVNLRSLQLEKLISFPDWFREQQSWFPTHCAHSPAAEMPAGQLVEDTTASR